MNGSNPSPSWRVIALLSCVFFHGAFGQTTPQVESIETLAALQARLSNHIAQPRFAAAAWGVKIISLDTGKVLFEHNAAKLLKPASNAKLYSGALALHRLGPDFRIRTSLYATARPDNSGMLPGDLIIYGRGDPSFAARFHNGEYGKILDPLVEAVVSAGVKSIQGGLIGDESYFRGPPLGSGWTWDDLQYYYGAEVSALTVQDNVVDLVFKPGQNLGEACRITASPETAYLTFSNRTTTVAAGGRRMINLYRPIGLNVVVVTGQLPSDDLGWTDAAAVHDPARWFVTLFQEALERRGIKVQGTLRTLNWLDRELQPLEPAKLVEIGSVESRPLAEMLGKMMKPSQNLYAQLCLLQAGARAPRATNASAFETTEEIGLRVLREFLDEAGVRKGDVLLEEGSGLSRAALLTPNATVALLKFMSRHPQADVFRQALPLAGVDGTLRNRMKGTAAAKNVQAKTGSLRYVNTLSGYVATAAREQLAFSIMLNNYDQSAAGTSAREDLDAIAILLSSFKGHTGAETQPVEK
ncbi:MAG: D-alanyl-D-alanine carboxypeptidase/D-alanyl-D-alanine-endopeptidase [Verrucomicrobiota bacterium]